MTSGAVTRTKSNVRARTDTARYGQEVATQVRDSSLARLDRADRTTPKLSFDLADSKLHPPVARPGTRGADRPGRAAARPRHVASDLGRRPAGLRQDDLVGPMGRANAAEGGLGLRRHPRQRSCRPADLHRRRVAPHRRARSRGVPINHRDGCRHQGPAAHCLGDGRHGATGLARHRPSRRRHEPGESRRRRRSRARTARWLADGDRLAGRRCRCPQRGCVLKAASWRSASERSGDEPRPRQLVADGSRCRARRSRRG